ncbi:hypothetical protein I5168_09495 [Nonlabens sp. SCSIO 43208]|uniref:hypothetical protein n=1 Tax=Nonlabens sp. SCSIO 43208 TaxID=2793009 RepID=UPI003D6B3860
MKKIKVNNDYWFSSIMGFLLIPVAPVSFLINILFKNLKISELPILVLVILTLYSFLTLLFLYKLLTERNFKTLKNQFSKRKNIEIVKNSLDKLEWSYTGGENGYLIRDWKKDKKLISLLRFEVVPRSNGISYNIIYSGGSKARFPFFFGIRTYLEWKFKNEIKTTYKSI